MEEIYLPNELVPSARKKKILEFIQRGPTAGTISVTLHEAGDFKHVNPSWAYDYGTDAPQIEAIVESINRHIANGFARDGRHYGTATIMVISRSGQRAGYTKEE